VSRSFPHLPASLIGRRVRPETPFVGQTPSRLIVEAARPNDLAIARSDQPAARQREISSRSVKLNRNGARRRATGPIPPARSSNARTVDGLTRICRDSTRTACPDRHRDHTSSTCARLNGRRFPTPTTPSHHRKRECQEVLR
jgi:hypothetical protein